MSSPSDLGSSVDPLDWLHYSELLRKLEEEKKYRKRMEEWEMRWEEEAKMLRKQEEEARIARRNKDPRVRLLDILRSTENVCEEKLRSLAKKNKNPNAFYINTLDEVIELRNTLREQCGGDLKKAFKKAIRVIPDEKWKEFVRTTLGLEQGEIGNCSPDMLSRDDKFKMLVIWSEKEEKKTGKKPSAEEFLDIVVDFLDDKDLVCGVLEQQRRSFDSGGGSSISSSEVVNLKEKKLQELKKFCKGKLYKSFYKAIDVVPNENWQEFVVTYLELSLSEYSKFPFDTFTSDRKFKILLAWANERQMETGRAPSSEEFCEILADFLAEKNLLVIIVNVTENIIAQAYAKDNGQISMNQSGGSVRISASQMKDGATSGKSDLLDCVSRLHVLGHLQL